ncbi:MAG TPA: hypothetical protein VGB97_00925 [Candidatus Paceibacterota bacterium]|jgi:hypothetical protein
MVDRLIMGVFGLLVFALVVLLGVIGYYVADSVNLPEHESSGQVSGKSYHHAYTSMVVVSTGRTTTVIPQYHPERYSICIFVDATQQIGCANYAQSTWNQVERGRMVRVAYTSGRFSGATYIGNFTY